MIKYYVFILQIFLISSISFSQSNPLPFGRTTLFAGSGSCAICHTGDGVVLTQNGVDVSPPTYWRSTMMANASKDPFWRAMVSEEIHTFPQLQQVIESTCTKCHSPMGFTEAMFDGHENYSIAEMKVDPVANDGVSCTVCHQINKDNFGTQQSFSGNYIINHDSTIYGPYENPETTAMISSFSYKPVYTTHMNESELCATCHTLFTPYINNQGEIAGTFAEQTPYIEWENSTYSLQGIQCQDCHLPKIYDPIDIASIPPTHTELRSPYWEHNFVGANAYMLQVLRNNITNLGLTASQENFDSTIVRAEDNLMNKALELSVSTEYKNDSLNIFVNIENKAGHKLPTGIPFRRMWIHLTVKDQSDNVLFESGAWDSQGKLLELDNSYEPHYNIITKQDQVQIYEGVLVDVDNSVTHTLLRASGYIKDNRIPPKGFLTTHESYDTTAIIGEALLDPDFNKTNGIEGSGADIVEYKIPASLSTNYKIKAEICLQTIKPGIAEHLASIDETDINQFVNIYNDIPNIPVIMKSVSLAVVTDVPEEASIKKGFYLSQNYPNPFNPSTIINYTLPQQSEVSLVVYDLLGNRVVELFSKVQSAGTYNFEFNTKKYPGKFASGIYYYKIQAGSYSETKKMVILK